MTLPYTGFVEVNDYVEDVIIPEMRTLANMGTEIMWCDIGGPNMTAEFASAWFNGAAEQGRQVVLDNRCGLPGDFDTPEYARYDAVQTRKWEVRTEPRISHEHQLNFAVQPGNGSFLIWVQHSNAR